VAGDETWNDLELGGKISLQVYVWIRTIVVFGLCYWARVTLTLAGGKDAD
jgi:hypothetical protein